MSETPAAPPPEEPPAKGRDKAQEVAHGVLRGTIAAMAMTGMRSFTVSVGLVDEAPPRAILRQKSKGIYRVAPKRLRRVVQEICHWSYGGVGGAGFAMLPPSLRRRPWSGPLYGLGIWFGFESGIAVALGLKQARKPRPVDRVALAADHLLYGLVLSEFRRRPWS